MAQHLIIMVEGQLLGGMTTNNQGGTRYDVEWFSRETGDRRSFPGEDTGEQTAQPNDDQERKEDFRHDFKHARRCLAAAAATAETFLEQLKGSGGAETKPIEVLLKTNSVDRGFIRLRPTGNERFDVDVHIGAGPTRAPDALPNEEWCRIWKAVDTSGANSHVARALKVLSSVAQELRDALPKSG